MGIQLLPDLSEEHFVLLDLILKVTGGGLTSRHRISMLLLSQDVRIRMLFEVCLSLEVRVEIGLGVRSGIVLLEILFRDEELCALLTLVELTALLGW